MTDRSVKKRKLNLLDEKLTYLLKRNSNQKIIITNTPLK